MTEQHAADVPAGLRVLTGGDLLKAADSCPRWPKCDECGGVAEIVCASPMWEAEGFIGKGKRAVFCCREHTAATSSWWWFWIIDEADQDDDCMGLWSRDSITHIACKFWGPPFLEWLLGSFDLSKYAEADARKEAAGGGRCKP